MERIPRPGFSARSPHAPGFLAGAAVVLVAASMLGLSGTIPGLGLTPGGGAPSSPSNGGPSGSVPVTPAATTPPALTVWPTSGPVGTNLTFNGTHFAGSSDFTVKNPSGTVVCSGKTTSKGVVSCYYVLAPTPGGAENFTGADAKGHTASATFTVDSRAVSTPVSGPVGTTVTFSGTGFGGASAQVAVNWTGPTGASVVACSVATDASGNGSFACSYTLPAAPAGAHPFYAKVVGGTLEAETNFTVVPALTAGPSFGPDGTTVTFSGTGFAAASTVTVTWSGGTFCSGTSLNTGNFSCSNVVPAGTAGGTYDFKAEDAHGNSATASFVLTYLTVAPATVSVGTTVNFTGGGFAPGKSVTLSWADGSACSTVSSSAGLVSCSYVLPPTPAGVYTFTATDGVGDTASTSLTIVPALSLNTTYGDPGTAVAFTGTGFGATVPVAVTWSPAGSTETACSTSTSSTGWFLCDYTIPLSTAGGSYTFTAEDSDSDIAAATFVVTYLTATPGSGPHGTTVALAGGGFDPGSKVSWTWGGQAVTCGSGTASSTGTVSCSFTTPYAPAGARPFVARDTNGDTATAPFSVTSSLSVSPHTVTVGTTLAFAATGFESSALVKVVWASNGTVACSGTTSVLGAVNCTVVLPPVPAGTYVFNATDPDADAATTTIVVEPAVAVAPSSGPGGTPVRFTGTGFAATSSLTVASSLGSACATTTAANGSFACAYTIPLAPSGSYTFKAVDASSNTASTAFAITPTLSASLPKGPVGTVVAFTGTGFASGHVANVTWSAGAACNATVSSSGGFSCSFAIPPIPTAVYTFTARDHPVGQSGDVATATFEVVPSLAVTPESGPVGTLLTFQGLGYPANQTVTVTWGAGAACAGTANAAGTFDCAYTLPATTAGPHVFTGTSGSAPVANATFTVVPALTIAPSDGPVGAVATLNGSGFAAAVYVNVSWAGGTACLLPTSSQGSFSCTLTVPPTPAGTYEFEATVASVVEATTNFTVVPALSVAPAGGPVGTAATFRATGFSGGVGISIVSSALGTACTGSTTPNGSFACTYTVPATPSGAYRFTATDARSNQASTTFTVGTTFVVSPTSGPVGTPIDFAATGFSSSTSATIALPGETVCSGTTTGTGNFSCGTTIPPAVLGPHTFTLTAGPSATTTFTVVAALVASPSAGPVGTSVRFNGTGFPASVSVSVTWTGSTSCSATSNASGSFSCSLTIPVGTVGGSYLFTATDTDHDTATATFTVVTGLTVTPNHGPAGTPVSLTGTNFPATVAFTITFGTGALVCTGTTNASGGLVCPYTIPASTPGGTYAFVAATATANASTLFVVTFLTATPNGVEVGTQVTLAGGGFAPSGLFTVSAPWGTVCHATTGPTGAFTCSTTVPATATPGAYDFTANDSASDVAVAPFSLFAISVPTPSVPSADVGQTVTFTTVATGGSGGLSYTWSESGSGLGCTLGHGATITCQPTGSGSYTVTVRVTDSDGFVSGSVTSSAFEVYASPTVTAPSPSRSSVDVGQTVTFTTTVSNGSGGYSYTWTVPAGLGCTVGHSDSITCTPGTSGVYTVTVDVTDSNGVTSPAVPSASYSVYADPTEAPPVASEGSADVGHTVEFSATVSGGSGGGSYVWTASSGLGCSSTSGATLTCKPGSVGSFTVSYVWTDSNGVVATGTTSLTYTVNVDPTESPPTASAKTADIGQTVEFSATVSGGSGGGSYAWTASSGLGCAASTGPVLSCTPSAAGSFTVSYVWTDSDGVAATGSTSLSYTVLSDPSVTALTASVGSADVGQTVMFTAAATGGSGGYVYSWSAPSGFGCTPSTTAGLNCTPTTPGVYAVTVDVTDSNGKVSATETSASITVSAVPTVSVPTPSRSSADVGQTVEFSTSVSGGSGGFTYTWTVPGGLGCSVGHAPSITCTPGTPGVYTVTVDVTDSNGVTSPAEGSSPFTVDALPTVTVPKANRTALDVGQTVMFTATGKGGAGTYVYGWAAPSGFGCAPSITASFNCTPTASGGYVVMVNVTDANGGVSTTEVSASITVSAVPTVSVPTPSRVGTDVGETVMFSTSGSGVGKLTYTWTVPAALGCKVGTTTVISCVPTAAGVYSVNVTVTDGNGGTSHVATLAAFLVSPKLVVTLVVSPTTVLSGHAVTYTATVSGGSGGLTYKWSGLPSGCKAPTGLTLRCTPTGSGTFVTMFNVTDSNMAVEAANATLTVQPAFLGLPATLGYEVVAGAAAAGVAAAGYFLVRRYLKRRPQRPKFEF